MTDKTKAIVSHIWLIGWIIVLIVNSKEKGPLATFYLRQTLGIYLVSILASVLVFVPFLGSALSGLISLATFVLWIISMINAVGEKTAPVPVVGEYFQDAFKNI